MAPGSVYVLATIVKADPERHYIYSAVFNSGGDPANDFQWNPPYDWDFFQRTDRWYQVI